MHIFSTLDLFPVLIEVLKIFSQHQYELGLHVFVFREQSGLSYSFGYDFTFAVFLHGFLYFYESALLSFPFLFSETLRNYFSQYGEVVDCVIMKDKTTNQSRGFGFVKFKDPNCVRTVLETKPHNLDGRNVSILNQRSRQLNMPVICCFLCLQREKPRFFIIQSTQKLFKETYSFSFGGSSLQTLVQVMLLARLKFVCLTRLTCSKSN